MYGNNMFVNTMYRNSTNGMMMFSGTGMSMVLAKGGTQVGEHGRDQNQKSQSNMVGIKIKNHN